MAFKRFLIDFSDIKSAEVDSIILWEHYLVYAVSLGIAERVIKKLKLAFPQKMVEDSDSVLMKHLCYENDRRSGHFYKLNSQINSVIRSASTARSSSSGRGGGFSGGSSGGSGGRGGGGAF